MRKHYASDKRRKGFTLIELVVVLVVIAALAALVVPNLGFVAEQAGQSASAMTAGQLVSNIETYRTTTTTYPNGLDSLIDENGDLYGALWTHVNPTFGPSEYFVVNTLDAAGLGAGSWGSSFGKSFNANNAGVRYVQNHVSTSPDPNNSATAQRVVDLADPATLNFAFVRRAAPAPTGPPAGPPPAVFLAEFHRAVGYPNGIPVGTELLVMGIGPNSGLRETMASTPRHTEQDADTYGRYFAVFAVYASGKPARLKAVVDSQGVSIDGNIDGYLSLAPEIE